jgi:DNA-binding response OmpR family regulator
MVKLQAPTVCKTLIVEDDRDGCEALALMLRRTGHEVECVETAGAALVKIEEWNPDCVLLDLMLPDAAGGIVLRKIRMQHLPMRVAVITAAGHTSPILKNALGYAPDAVFHKPLHYAELNRWLSQQVNLLPPPAGYPGPETFGPPQIG